MIKTPKTAPPIVSIKKCFDKYTLLKAIIIAIQIAVKCTHFDFDNKHTKSININASDVWPDGNVNGIWLETPSIRCKSIPF